MEIYRMKNNGGEPSTWKTVKVANVGASEEFVKTMLDLHPVVDATTIREPKRQEVKEAITSILMDALTPAFLDLQQIRSAIGQDIPLMDRQQPFENLARKLWKAYKELMQKAARLMGFKIGFLFDDDKKFSEGLQEFRNLHPEVREFFEEYLKEIRQSWANDLSRFRNKWLEHQTGDRKDFEKFYTPAFAEDLFRAVWQSIANILPLLIEGRLSMGTRLVEQHPDDPGPRWPNRFRYDISALRNLGDKT